MRIIILAIVSLYSLVSVLQAQVAAPMLNPAGFIDSSSFNPAVLNWGGPSRVGGAILDVDIEDTAGGTTPLASGDGYIAQARFVGDNMAFHAELFSASLDIEPAAGGGSLEADGTLFGASYQWDDSFSIGISIASEDNTDPGGNSETSLPLLGATMRFGDNLLVGAATGTESSGDGSGVGDVDRSVLMIGAALHSRDKMGGYHLEAYIDNMDSGEDTASGNNEPEESTFGLTAEAVFMENLFIGIELINTDITDPTDPTGAGDTDVDETKLSVGWVSGQGLSFVATSSTEEETDTAGGVVKTSILLLAVTNSF